MSAREIIHYNRMKQSPMLENLIFFKQIHSSIKSNSVSSNLSGSQVFIYDYKYLQDCVPSR